MKDWANRPKEEAYLLNPAFCCTILVVAMKAFENVSEQGVPFPLTFMFLPIILHKPTREKLPPSTSTSMAVWIQENADSRVLFYERLVSLKPYTKEAIQFGMLAEWIVPGDSGLLKTTRCDSDVNRYLRELDAEARLCVLRARFLGKWFGMAGETHTVMAFWGVRP